MYGGNDTTIKKMFMKVFNDIGKFLYSFKN